MSGDAADTAKPRKTWVRRIAALLVGLAVSLIAGKIIESISDRQWLEEAVSAQKQWIAAVGSTSPVGVASLYWTEVSGVYSGDTSGRSMAASFGFDNWLFAPLVALATTVWLSFRDGGIAILIQIAIGALAIGVFNFTRTNGRTLLFSSDPFTVENVLFLPIAIMAGASLIGMVLWVVLMGALSLLGGITSLAVWAAGATGIVGFCWLCVTKLAEKGAEHVMTPKI